MKTSIQIGCLGQSRKSLLNILAMSLAGSSQGGNGPHVCHVCRTQTEIEDAIIALRSYHSEAVVCVSTAPNESVGPEVLMSFVKEISIQGYDFPFINIKRSQFKKPEKGTFPKTRTHTGSRRGHHGFW